jgi:hypothetical protein
VLNPGSALAATASSFNSNIDVTGGSLSLMTSTVRTIPTEAGGITPSTTGTVQINNSAIYGDIADDNDGTWGQANTFTLHDSVVTSGGASRGSVRMEGLASAPRAIISGDRIDGFLALRAFATTVDYTHIGKGASFGYLRSVEMCSVHVVGDLRIEHTGAGGVILGGYANPAKACIGGVKVHVDGNLTLSDNVGLIKLLHVTVDGNLVCSGNTTRPSIGDLTIGGIRSGQCA